MFSFKKVRDQNNGDFMAVLIEGISVIIKRKSIEEKYSGGWDSFLNYIPKLQASLK